MLVAFLAAPSAAGLVAVPLVWSEAVGVDENGTTVLVKKLHLKQMLSRRRLGWIDPGADAVCPRAHRQEAAGPVSSAPRRRDVMSSASPTAANHPAFSSCRRTR